MDWTCAYDLTRFFVSVATRKTKKKKKQKKEKDILLYIKN